MVMKDAMRPGAQDAWTILTIFMHAGRILVGWLAVHLEKKEREKS